MELLWEDGRIYLECSDGTFYTGSTNNLDLRLLQHQNGEGANHTKKRLPVKLVYYEEFQRIDEAFYREKQVQGWSRKKKEALINSQSEKLPELAIAYRDLKKWRLKWIIMCLREIQLWCLRDPQAPNR